MNRLSIIVRALSLTVLVGMTLGVASAAIIVFDKAPTREIAGQIGVSAFGLLSRIVFVAAVILLAVSIVIRRRHPSLRSKLNLFLSTGIFVVAAILALWLTPGMVYIWETAPHDPAGGGLIGEDRSRFMMLHGIGNLGYLAIVAVGIALTILGPGRPKRD